MPAQAQDLEKNDITKTIIEKNPSNRYRIQFYSDSLFSTNVKLYEELLICISVH